MNRVVCLFVFLSALLCGCTNLKLNIETRYLPQDEPLQKLTTTKPVAVKNISTSTIENQICAPASNFKIFGKLYNFTNSALGTVKEALGRQSVIIDEKADKVIELSVYEANCMPGAFTTKTAMALRVRAGDRLEKVYKGDANIGNLYAASAGFEIAILDSVSQMLKDKDIINYIEN